MSLLDHAAGVVARDAFRLDASEVNALVGRSRVGVDDRVAGPRLGGGRKAIAKAATTPTPTSRFLIQFVTARSDLALAGISVPVRVEPIWVVRADIDVARADLVAVNRAVTAVSALWL